MIKLDKTMLLAAELFKYSYDHYADHVEIGNARFTRHMPDDVNKLLEAEREGWSDEKIAQELEIKQSDVKIYLEQFQKAKKIVASVNPSEAFRYSVKESIITALESGLKTDKEIDDLVIQICYRAADLGYLLALEGSQLSEYSEWLRRERNVDYTGVGLPNLE